MNYHSNYHLHENQQSEMKVSLLLDEDEYVEELEPAEPSTEEHALPKKKSSARERTKHCKLTRRTKSVNSNEPVKGPDYRWDESSTPDKDKSLSKRTKLRRSVSLDGSSDREAIFRRRQTTTDDASKRHSWDCPRRPRRSGTTSPEKQEEPDFRWDNPDFRWDKFEGHIISKENAKPRRKPPRRTKSDLTAYDRPGSGRGRVTFCLDNNVCFEVPRASKDMKPDLFYTKKEIKEFKAERKEEKQRAVMEKLEAQMAHAKQSFGSMSGGAPIATSC